MIPINDYLGGVLEGFQAYLREGHQLCDLKALNYDQGQVPNYEDLHVQQYYLLRYAYGYAFEYKGMFGVLLERGAFDETISVTSIGCGAALDYWSLVRMLEQRNQAHVSVQYTGIDLVSWNYRFQTRGCDRVAFYTGDAAQTLAKNVRLESDVYVFPKSISEFSDNDFQRLCGVFQTAPILKDAFHILASIRTDENSQERDFQRIRQLRCAIVENGFQADDSRDKLYIAQEPEKKIRQTDSDFKHPSDVVDCLRKLNTCCSHYQNGQGNCQPDCRERLIRWPILKQEQGDCPRIPAVVRCHRPGPGDLTV